MRFTHIVIGALCDKCVVTLVGCWLVTFVNRGETVGPYILMNNTDRKLYPRNSVVPFQLPSVAPNLRSGSFRTVAAGVFTVLLWRRVERPGYTLRVLYMAIRLTML